MLDEDALDLLSSTELEVQGEMPEEHLHHLKGLVGPDEAWWGLVGSSEAWWGVEPRRNVQDIMMLPMRSTAVIMPMSTIFCPTGWCWCGSRAGLSGCWLSSCSAALVINRSEQVRP